MYRVVGCSACDALWVLADRPKTTECPRCKSRYRTDNLKTFHKTDNKSDARELRATLIAERADQTAPFSEVGHFSEIESDATDAGLEEDVYLDAIGLPVEEIRSSGRGQVNDVVDGGSRNRHEVVLSAVREVEESSEQAIVTYCEAHGVPAEAAREILSKLIAAGEIIENDGRYRPL